VSNGIASTEKDVIKLLTAMGADKKSYPKNLFAARRAAYVLQVTALVGSGLHPRNGGRQIQGGSTPGSVPMTPLMKVVLTALIAGNIALATYLAVNLYHNWDKVQGLLFGTPLASETSQAPFIDPIQEPEFDVSPESSVVPEVTSQPTSPLENASPSGGKAPDNQQESTPEPSGDDKPGLHLGQTPHGPDEPPSSNNEDNSQNNNQGNQDKNKDK
jgi:hypothetical protein